MQLQKLKGSGRIERHNALQACDLEDILQVSAAGKAAAMLRLPQKLHSNLYATGKNNINQGYKWRAKKQSQDDIVPSIVLWTLRLFAQSNKPTSGFQKRSRHKLLSSAS